MEGLELRDSEPVKEFLHFLAGPGKTASASFSSKPSMLREVSMFWSIRPALFSLGIVLAVAHATGHAQSPAALLQQSANAMGGLAALRALKTQVIESEGKQFDSSSTAQPLGPSRQITTFRSTLTRDLTRPDCGWCGRGKAWRASKLSALLKLSTAPPECCRKTETAPSKPACIPGAWQRACARSTATRQDSS
jgi:hypothetical protein